MTKQTQIELAKYIERYIQVNNTPNDAEHIANAIECFYSDYKEMMVQS